MLYIYFFAARIRLHLGRLNLDTNHSEGIAGKDVGSGNAGVGSGRCLLAAMLLVEAKGLADHTSRPGDDRRALLPRARALNRDPNAGNPGNRSSRATADVGDAARAMDISIRLYPTRIAGPRVGSA